MGVYREEGVGMEVAWSGEKHDDEDDGVDNSASLSRCRDRYLSLL